MVNLPWHSLRHRRILRLPGGFLELALGEGWVEGVLYMSVASEMLLETWKLAHPLLVGLKVGEVLEGL